MHLYSCGSSPCRRRACYNDRMIEISLNGKPERLSEGVTIAELVRQKLPGVSRVALELNLEIVPRSQFEQRQLKAGDRVEIVRAIGGG